MASLAPARHPHITPMQTRQQAEKVEAAAEVRAHRQSLSAFRLCHHADYQRAYEAGRKHQSALMSWFLAPQATASSAPRVGLTVGKVVGKAHERNRIKRRMREVLRRHLAQLPRGFDLILHPRRTVLTVNFDRLEMEIHRILDQAGNEAAKMRTSLPNGQQS